MRARFIVVHFSSIALLFLYDHTLFFNALRIYIFAKDYSKNKFSFQDKIHCCKLISREGREIMLQFSQPLTEEIVEQAIFRPGRLNWCEIIDFTGFGEYFKMLLLHWQINSSVF